MVLTIKTLGVSQKISRKKSPKNIEKFRVFRKSSEAIYSHPPFLIHSEIERNIIYLRNKRWAKEKTLSQLRTQTSLIVTSSQLFFTLENGEVRGVEPVKQVLI